MPTSPAEIRARHERVDEWAGFPVAICEVCQTPWPCDVAILLSTIEKLEKVANAAGALTDWIAEVSPESHVERIGELYDHAELVDVALRALEGKPPRALGNPTPEDQDG